MGEDEYIIVYERYEYYWIVCGCWCLFINGFVCYVFWVGCGKFYRCFGGRIVYFLNLSVFF